VRPANANVGRTQHFRAALRRPGVVTALVLAPSAALLAGAASAGPLGALAAPILVLALILAWAWNAADRVAEKAFWTATAAAIGFEPFFDLGELQLTTPLLHAGDRREFTHELKGPLGATGLPVRLAHYRYDVRREGGKDGHDSWAKYRFTVCVVELEAGMGLFRGIYLRARRGLVGRAEHDWLKHRRLREVELESTDFNEAYELLVANDQDQGRLRELFDPKTIVWLAEHPLRPHFEFRAGFLVVYVPGHLEDLGRVVWLLEAAERLAGRVRTEIAEAVTSR
jgi:hypothetical protein